MHWLFNEEERRRRSGEWKRWWCLFNAHMTRSMDSGAWLIGDFSGEPYITQGEHPDFGVLEPAVIALRHLDQDDPEMGEVALLTVAIVHRHGVVREMVMFIIRPEARSFRLAWQGDPARPEFVLHDDTHHHSYVEGDRGLVRGINHMYRRYAP